ncbi:MAG: glycine betaine/L-proline ABC transporter substrate-binding protein ProX [Alphaproteobacteria bacterium]|nr:glycine betaine/L-proline ABC transporter substrate-binding protein ProX [Alphaproteobacteria bacterium]
MIKKAVWIAAGMLLSVQLTPNTVAADSVKPIYQGVSEELFQTYIVGMGLEELGYEVDEPTVAQMQASFVAVVNGDASFYPAFWWPLHKTFWEQQGGDAVWQRAGTLVENSLQGYLIDKATAEAQDITTLDQLQDPELAKLFDIDGNGKADLYGCETGWGCERVIEHQLDAYELRDTVEHRQGGYFAIIPDAVERIRSGQPTLYYTWTPLWLSGVLRPGHEVVWLNVPFTSLPDGRTEEDSTTVEGIGNLGFAVNTQHVIASTAWLEANPVAGKWFELLQIPIDAINAQNMRVNEGEKSDEQIRQHARDWIEANQAQWDSWIAEAQAAQ